MVFVTVGSTHMDFSRLFRAVDDLVKEGGLKHVVAQIGPSVYEPKYYEYHRFLTRAHMQSLMATADFVIAHGGAAILDECLSFRRKVIVAPRQSEYGECPDNHQYEIVEYLEKANRVLVVRDMTELKYRVAEIDCWEPVFSKTQNTRRRIVTAIRKYMRDTMPK